jgi:hypothetical protein
VTDARHDDHIKVVDRLARIETKLDMILDLEPRMRLVENRMWFFSGGAAAIGLLGNYILKKLGLA